jgi:hypothetical protein
MSHQPSGDASGDRTTSRSGLKRKREEKEREAEWKAADEEAKGEQAEQDRRLRAHEEATEKVRKHRRVMNKYEDIQSTEGLRRAAVERGWAMPAFHPKFPVSAQGQARDVPRQVVDHSEAPAIEPGHPDTPDWMKGGKMAHPGSAGDWDWGHHSSRFVSHGMVQLGRTPQNDL